MNDVRLPDRKTLKTLWEKIGNVLCLEGLSALPLQMGPIKYQSNTKQKCNCVSIDHSAQKVVDRNVTVHKFMNSNCTAA